VASITTISATCARQNAASSAIPAASLSKL
jgi:hypothetical protein